MDSGNGKQVVGYDTLNMQLDPQQGDQSNIGCSSQMQGSINMGYNGGPVHHTEKQYLNQDMSYNHSMVPRMQLRDPGTHGMMTVRPPTQKSYNVDNYGNNGSVINTSPSRGRVVPQIHYLREDNSAGNVSLQHQQQTREDSNTSVYMGTSNTLNALQREDSGCSSSTSNAAHLPRGNGNIQVAKDAFRLSQNMNDNTMMSETSDDGSYKLVTKDYTERNLPQELMSKMFGLLKEGMFCDAVVLAGDKEIRVHKMVLIAASPFLLSKMSKTTPSTSLRVELPTGIPLQVASQLVHYLYDGRVTLTTDNVAQFARVANLFKLEHLVNICEDFVNCFCLDQSLLTVLEEDIEVVATIPEEDHTSPTKPSPVKQSPQKEESMESNATNELLAIETAKCKKSKCKSIVKKLKDDLNMKEQPEISSPHSNLTKIKKKDEKIEMDVQQPKTTATVSSAVRTPTVTHKISHFYGTRAASKGKRGDSHTKSEEQIVLVTSTTPVKKNGKKGKKGAKKDTKPFVMVKEGKMILMYNDHDKKAADTESKLNTCTPNSDHHELSEGEELDLGKDGDPDWNMMIEDNQFMSYDHKKTGRQKRNPIDVPVKAEMPLRPPPKKRAREFTKNEEEFVIEKLEDPSNSVIDLPAVLDEGTTKETLGSNKQKNKKKKVNKPKPCVISKKFLTTLVTNLESQAEHIPENERQYKCNLCGNEFVFAKRSITHVLNTHEISSSEVLSFLTIRKFERSPKVCDICGYETKDPNFYYIHYHKYFRHGVPLPKGWKPYTCDICGKECFTKFQLKDHKRVHTEGIPFICEVCGQGFKSRTCLNSHVFHKHNTVRKHECKECGKSFKTRTQLLVHCRIHSGEKPFHCPDCAYKSTTRGNMRLHLTNKHKFNEEAIKCMMYQIKTKSLEVQNDEATQLIIDTPTSEANIKQEIKGKKKKGKKQPDTTVQNQINDFNVYTQNNQDQLEAETVQCNYQNSQNVSDMLINTSQQQANYTTDNIILQQYQGQQIIGEIQPGHPNLVQEVSDSSGTTTHVLLPAEHFSQGQHYVVQAHHTDSSTNIISPVANQSLGHDPRSLPQETHILCPQALVSGEQIILSEQDQLALTTAARVQGQLYSDRDLSEEAQMLVADRGSITPLQDAMNLQTPDKVNELQNVPQQVLIDGSNQGVQIHIQTVQLQTDEHGQIIAHRDKNGKNFILGDSCTQRPSVALIHDDGISEKGDNETILSANLHKQQQQQHMGQIAIAHDILPETYHQVVYSSSPNTHNTFVVNSQSTGTTSIETSGQMSTPGPSSSTGQTNPSPSQSPATLVNQGYSDQTIYQFYPQQYQTY